MIAKTVGCNFKMKKTNSNNSDGFAILEIIVLIVLAVSLAFLAFTGYSKFQRRAAENAIKSDLAGAVYYVKQFAPKIKNVTLGGYVANEGVVLKPNTTGKSSYCIVGTHKKYADMKWYVTLGDTNPKTGDCPE